MQSWGTEPISLIEETGHRDLIYSLLVNEIYHERFGSAIHIWVLSYSSLCILRAFKTMELFISSTLHSVSFYFRI